LRHWIVILGLCAVLPAAAGISVSLRPSVASPSFLGTPVTWTASASEAGAGTVWYRFRARRTGRHFHVIQDYGPVNTLDWTAISHEGTFEIEASVRNRDSGETAVSVVSYEMLSLVRGDQPVITATAHPLIFIYSAPPCAPGSRMLVEFALGDTVQRTPYQPCADGLSMNFYLAGMRGESVYQVHHTVDAVDGPALNLTAGRVPVKSPAMTLVQAPAAHAENAILMQGALFTYPVATDLEGNVIWYYPKAVSFLTEPAQGGRYFSIIEDGTSDLSRQVLREFDLAGFTLRETNAARINEQLAAMGKPPVNSFHHEARQLPGGRILTVAGLERILTDVQGAGMVDVLGEMIIVLGPDLDVVWTWDAFDHLDASKRAVLGETCTSQTCAPIYLAAQANDWLHANAVDVSPDGNLLLSSRHLDWLIKIDYRNGEGTGDVIWKLGKDGDFRFDSTDPYPWFSHQHDAGFVGGSNTLVAVFDNGNTRRMSDPTATSRGQVIELDETNRVARLVVNVDLGVYSSALGSAQQLPNGNYHFGCGFLADQTSESMEVDAGGNIVYALRVAAPEYRSYRMRDMYSPP
jgi:arylsulfate sulfotransferase